MPLDLLSSKVTVVGVGRMGAQIGAGFSLSSRAVVLWCRSSAAVEAALHRAHAALAQLSAIGVVHADDARAAAMRLSGTATLEEACVGGLHCG